MPIMVVVVEVVVGGGGGGGYTGGGDVGELVLLQDMVVVRWCWCRRW